MPKRLQGWDYTSTATYFVTICTLDRLPVLASVRAETSIPTALGHLVERHLLSHAAASGLVVQRSVVMPDHIHAILRADGAGATMTVEGMVRLFKAEATREARRSAVLATSRRLWQRGFFDRVIRSEREYAELVAYIDTNPLRWTLARQRNRPTSRTATK